MLSLAERLGRTVTELLESTTSAELSEWMAYDLMRSDSFREKYQKELELIRFESLTPEQKTAEWKKVFRGKNG